MYTKHGILFLNRMCKRRIFFLYKKNIFFLDKTFLYKKKKKKKTFFFFSYKNKILCLY